ncbi:hypothetical protein AAEX37_02430 [Oligella sp. MSHR50489EDL]|uniref:metal ABC transporter solute-binding protein, Zn/Mn family n=1 Tax=Oligella sp. MSHR50489EDL TaxID=3139409 RepID=UPI003D81ADAA
MKKHHLLMLLLSLYLPSVHATTLLTGHPITTGIAEMLSKNTTLSVQSAVPKNLPASRHLNYFENRGKDELAKLSREADAVISVKRIFTADFLYPLARRHHIRLVPIDIATPIDGEGMGVAMLNLAIAEHPVWLDPENLNVMMTLFVREVEKLDPSQKATLQAQLAEARQRLQKITQAMQTSLDKAAKTPSVLLMQEEYAYFTQGLQLESTPYTADEEAAKNLAAFEKVLQEEGITLVISKQDPTPEEEAIISKHQVAWLKMPRLKSTDPVAQLEAIYQDFSAWLK